MSFLAPLMLFFAFTIPVVIVLYLLKLKREIRVVSSTVLWQRFLLDSRANAPFQKLRRNLLLLLQLLILILAGLAILSIDRDRVAFVSVTPAAAGQGLFAATAERAYVAVGIVIGLVVGPLQAASRTLLVRIAPAGRLTQFFGLYALSARVTSFVAPFLVALITDATQNQKAGMAGLLLFFAGGAMLLRLVEAGGAFRHRSTADLM